MLAITELLTQYIPCIVWAMGGVTINRFWAEFGRPQLLRGIWRASVAALRKQDGSSQLMF